MVVSWFKWEIRHKFWYKLNFTFGIFIQALTSLVLKTWSWVPVVHTCNPSYSGGRNQEDSGQLRQIVLEIETHHKKGLVEWLNDLRCRPWVQAPISNKQTKKRHGIIFSDSNMVPISIAP
jgi:hypothetical protein